jgi:hypothetical protein
MRKTATIERYHCYGTPNHHVAAYYRGKRVSYSDYSGGYWNGVVVLDAVHTFGVAQQSLLHNWRQRLKGLGFTHWRFVGDWGPSGLNKPQDGKL